MKFARNATLAAIPLIFSCQQSSPSVELAFRYEPGEAYVYQMLDEVKNTFQENGSQPKTWLRTLNG